MKGRLPQNFTSLHTAVDVHSTSSQIMSIRVSAPRCLVDFSLEKSLDARSRPCTVPYHAPCFLLQVLETMEPEALVALVVFTGVVSVYRLGKAGAAVADVFPGGEPLPQQASGIAHFCRAARPVPCCAVRYLFTLCRKFAGTLTVFFYCAALYLYRVEFGLDGAALVRYRASLCRPVLVGYCAVMK